MKIQIILTLIMGVLFGLWMSTDLSFGWVALSWFLLGMAMVFDL